MIIDDNVYLEHYGKKGMKWGQRKQQNRESRRARFAAGKPTQRDKLISDLDLDRTRAERKAGVNPLPARGKRVDDYGKTGKIALVTLAGGAMALTILNATGNTPVSLLKKISKRIS